MPSRGRLVAGSRDVTGYAVSRPRLRVVRSRLLRIRMWWLAALAAAGVVVTHALTYRLAQTDEVLRHQLLHDTGHELWPPFVAPMVLAALVLGAAGALTRSVNGVVPIRATAMKLAALQGASWMAVEAAERFATGHDQLTWRSLLPVVLGLAVQVLVAVAAAVFLLLLGRIADAWRARHRRGWPRRPTRWRPAFASAPSIRVVAAAWSPRGPPRR